MDYIVTLTDAEAKALAWVAADPQEWIENAVQNRCNIAIEEIFRAECDRIIAEGGQISGTRDEIVLAAPIKSAQERLDEMIAESKKIDFGE